MCKICTYFSAVGWGEPRFKHTKIFWTLGDGLVLSNFWKKQARRPYLSKNVSFLKEGRNGGICEGHERGGAFEEEGGEGDVRMSFLHLETVLYN